MPRVANPEAERGDAAVGNTHGERPNRPAGGGASLKPAIRKGILGIEFRLPAESALKQGSAYVEGGYSTVVDLDLEKFFDKVNHTRLMARLARDMKEGRLLRLILKFLKAGLMQDGVCRRREEGTPQGGPSRFERGKSG